MKTPLRIAVADDESEVREFFTSCLTRMGHNVVAEAQTGKELVESCHAQRPDLVITDIKMPDMDGINAAVAVNRERPVPVILVSAYHDADLLARAAAEPVMAYLVKPIKQSNLEAAVSVAMQRFLQLHAAQQEAAALKTALEDRKLIDRAKGIVMKRLTVDEPEAYRRLRKLASDQNLKLVEVARSILASEAMFASLERI
jgi:response regulator NasT